MSFTRYERNKAVGLSTGQRLPPPRTDLSTICHKTVLAPRYALGFCGQHPLEGVWGWDAMRKMVVPPWHTEICCRPERQQLRLERCPLSATVSPPFKGERLREQTVGVKRFSLAGTTVSLCKNKEMGYIFHGTQGKACETSKGRLFFTQGACRRGKTLTARWSFRLDSHC